MGLANGGWEHEDRASKEENVAEKVRKRREGMLKTMPTLCCTDLLRLGVHNGFPFRVFVPSCSTAVPRQVRSGALEF